METEQNRGFCCGEQQENRVNSDSKKKEATKEALGADVYHLGEAMTRGTTMKFCSTHYRSDFEPILLSLSQFDKVKISVSRKPYGRYKRCDHADGEKRCREIPVYRITLAREQFLEALAV